MPVIDPNSKLKFYTIAEIAQRWAMHPQSVRRYHMQAGGLAGIDVGQQVIVSAPSLSVYEERLKQDIRGKIKKLQRMLKGMEQAV
jgi:hypothetical protein